MKSKERLSEEKYQKKKRKIMIVSLMIFIIGLLIGGSLILIGIMRKNDITNQYSENNKKGIEENIKHEKENLKTKKEEQTRKRKTNLNEEKKLLETKKAELEKKGIKYDLFTQYTDGEAYDLKIITEVLDPSFLFCAFDAYKNNSLTTNYCALINNVDTTSKDIKTIDNVLNSNFNYCMLDEYVDNPLTNKYCTYLKEDAKLTNVNKNIETIKFIPYYVTGGFVIVITIALAFIFYLIAKRRDIIAFSIQQMKPIVEGKMILDQKMKEEDLPPHCPHCGAPTKKKIICEYCGCKIIK